MKNIKNKFIVATIIIVIIYVIIIMLQNLISNEVLLKNLKELLTLTLNLSLSLSVILSIKIQIDNSINAENFYAGNSLADITEFLKENDFATKKEINKILYNSNIIKNAIYHDFEIVKKYIEITNVWIGIVELNGGYNSTNLCGFTELFNLIEYQYEYDVNLIIDSKVRDLLLDTISIAMEISNERSTHYVVDATKLITIVNIKFFGEVKIYMDYLNNPNNASSYDYDYEYNIIRFKKSYDIFYLYVRERKFIADTQ